MFLRRNSGASKVGYYPPIYYERLRDARRGWVKWFAFFTPVTLLTVFSFVGEWKNPLPVFAPFLGAVWIYSAISAPFSLRDDAIACVLPYFPKNAPSVEADTFLRGHALARNFQLLELWAHEHDLIPLSTFGWNDDLRGEPLAWHEAALGLQTVTSLLEHSDLSPELREDLARLHSALCRAQEVGTPFCLLLRHGDSVSGAEMDARQGTF